MVTSLVFFLRTNFESAPLDVNDGYLKVSSCNSVSCVHHLEPQEGKGSRSLLLLGWCGKGALGRAKTLSETSPDLIGGEKKKNPTMHFFGICLILMI